MSPICASVSASHVKSGSPQNVLHGVLLSHVREAKVPEMCFSLFLKNGNFKGFSALKPDLIQCKDRIRNGDQIGNVKHSDLMIGHKEFHLNKLFLLVESDSTFFVILKFNFARQKKVSLLKCDWVCQIVPALISRPVLIS